MGWNSFDGFGVYIDETRAQANLEAFHKLLAPHGYDYFVIDGGWHGEYARQPGSDAPAERHAEVLNLDGFGRPEPAASSFPNGFEPLIDQARSLGVKFGLHLMRGISRQAIEQRLPVLGTDFTAADIALPDRGCRWCPQNVGVDVQHPGGRAYYRSLVAKLAEWGVDFLKIDDITAFPDEIDAMLDAVDAVGHPMVVSLSPGGDTSKEHLRTYRRSQMLRVTKDIWDDHVSIERTFDAMKAWQAHQSPRPWIDLDMIPFGALMQMTPNASEDGNEQDFAFCGQGSARSSELSPAQKRTFMLQRAIFASPLMVGCDLTQLGGLDHELLTCRALIACNQNARCVQQLRSAGHVDIWQADRRGEPGSGWLGLFNRSRSSDAHLSLESIAKAADLADRPLKAIDLPGQDALPGDGKTVRIAADDAVLLAVP
jgi:hypothetical protein